MEVEVIQETPGLLITFLENWGELTVAIVALLVSLIAMIKASKAEKLQNKINELELLIKQNEYEKIQKEQEKANYSCVEARVISLGSKKHHMRIWNSGNTTVYNVSAHFDGDVDIMILDGEKQPFEELEPNKNYDLSLFLYGGSQRKFKIITEWEDKDGNKHSKTQMGDV